MPLYTKILLFLFSLSLTLSAEKPRTLQNNPGLPKKQRPATVSALFAYLLFLHSYWVQLAGYKTETAEPGSRWIQNRLSEAPL